MKNTLLSISLDVFHLIIMFILIIGPYLVSKKYVPFMCLLFWAMTHSYYDYKCHITKLSNKTLKLKPCVNFTERYFMSQKDIDDIDCCEFPKYPPLLWYLTLINGIYLFYRLGKEYKINIIPNGIPVFIIGTFLITFIICTYCIDY